MQGQGYSLSQISEQLKLAYGTACKLSAQLKRQGDLQVRYQNCGAKKPCTPALIVRAALWLRRQHPLWGAPFIRLQLARRYTGWHIPAARTLQRWFRHAKLSPPPRQQLNQPRIGTAKAVHNIWQVDAKEKLTLADGSEACYLTITDEHSGAGLAALVFPPPLHSSSTAGGAQSKAAEDL